MTHGFTNKHSIEEALSGTRNVDLNKISSIAKRNLEKSRERQTRSIRTPFEKGLDYHDTQVNKTIDSNTGTEDLSQQFDHMMDLTMNKLKDEPFKSGKVASRGSDILKNFDHLSKNSDLTHVGLKGRTKLSEIDDKINKIFGRDFSNERHPFKKKSNYSPYSNDPFSRNSSKGTDIHLMDNLKEKRKNSRSRSKPRSKTRHDFRRNRERSRSSHYDRPLPSSR